MMDAQTIRFACPVSGKAFKAPLSSAGKHGRCTRPGCAAEFVVPSLPAAELLPESASLPDLIASALAAHLPDDFLFVLPHVPAGSAARVRRRAAVPADEILLGVLDYSSSESSVRCLVFGTRGAYFKGRQADAEFVPYQEFLGAGAKEWQKVSVLGRIARSVGGGNATAEATALRLLRGVRQVCAANPSEVPDERGRIAAEEQQREAELGAEIVRFAQRHLPGRPVRYAGIACETTVEEVPSLAGGLLSVVASGLLDANLGGTARQATSHFLQLVAVTQKNLFVFDLGTLPAERLTREAVYALGTDDAEEDQSAALSRLVVAETLTDETGGRVALRGELEDVFVFPVAFGRENALMAKRIAEAVAARRGA